MDDVPHAADISVSSTLALYLGPHKGVADGVSAGEYALWLGSGISRGRVDDVGEIVLKVVEYLRSRSNPTQETCPFNKALDRILDLAQLSNEEHATIDKGQPVMTWGCVTRLKNSLSPLYARVLDERVDGEVGDYLLWSAVDVPKTFGEPDNPDAEHLCVALLALEGVVPDIVTTNWDGLIEAALRELTGGNLESVVRVCVRNEDLRGAGLRSRLLKVHGCAVLAGQDETVYRGLLVGRQSDIIKWSTASKNAPIRDQLVGLATTKPTLMVGLSTQDFNLQDVFSKAHELMSWRWPHKPHAYVFAEDSLGADQKHLLTSKWV